MAAEPAVLNLSAVQSHSSPPVRRPPVTYRQLRLTSSAGEPRAFRMPMHESHATRINGLMATWVVGRTGRMGQWYGRVRGLLLLLPLATHGLRPQQRSPSLMSDAPHNTSTALHEETPSAAKLILPIHHQNPLHQASQPLALPGKSTLCCTEPTQRQLHPLPWRTKLIGTIQTILAVVHNFSAIKHSCNHLFATLPPRPSNTRTSTTSPASKPSSTPLFSLPRNQKNKYVRSPDV